MAPAYLAFFCLFSAGSVADAVGAGLGAACFSILASRTALDGTSTLTTYLLAANKPA